MATVTKNALAFLALLSLSTGLAQADHHKYAGPWLWGHAPHTGGIALSGSWESRGTTSACSSGCTVSVTPIAPTSGDEIVIYFAVENATAGTCPTLAAVTGGMTADGTAICTNSHYTSLLYHHTAGASETTYSFSLTSALAGNFSWGITVMDFSGLNTSSPLDAISAYTTEATGATFTSPALTTNFAGSLVVACDTSSNRITGSTGGWPIVSFYGSVVIPNEGCVYQTQLGTGAISPPTITLNASSSNIQAVSAAYKHS